MHFSKSDNQSLMKIIEYLEKGKNIFLLGPRGFGKSTLIKSSIDKIQNSLQYECVYFNMEKDTKNDAYIFYSYIVEKTLDKSTTNNFSINKIQSNLDISTILLDQLDKNIKSPTILIFDRFRAVNHEFYEHFCQDCISIVKKGEANPGSGLSKIKFIFSGSLISSHELNSSPIWDICERIELTPEGESEFKDYVISCIKKNTSNINTDHVKFIMNSTKGHRFLACELAQFIYTQNITNLDSFISYIWDSIFLDNQETKISDHFKRLAEYLETSPDVLNCVNALPNRLPCSESLNFDHVTLTGAFIKKEGYYECSNPIYQNFFELLNKNNLLGDFCIFHIQNEKLWNAAKEQYNKNYYDGRSKRFQNIVFPTHIENINRLINKLRERLSLCSSLNQLTQEFIDIITLFFGITTCGMLDLSLNDKDQLIEYNDNIICQEVSNTRIVWLTKKDLDNHKDSIKKAAKNKAPILDWTGRLLFIPVIVGDHFGVLFIAQIDSIKQLDQYQQAVQQGLIDFIFDSLTKYYYLWIKEVSEKRWTCVSAGSKEVNNLRQLTPYSRKNMHELWKHSRELIHQIGIKDYTYHELLADDYVISTEGKSATLNDIKTKASDELLGIKKTIKKLNNNFLYSNNLNTHYFVKVLDNNVITIFECHFNSSEFYKIEKQVNSVFNIFQLIINKLSNISKLDNQIEIQRAALFHSENYLYVINKKREILFISQNLGELLKKHETDSELIGSICYELMSKKSICKDCPIYNINEIEESVRLVRRIMFSDNNYRVLDCIYVPISDAFDNRPKAFAVYMHDVTERQLLWQNLEDMVKMNSISEVEKYFIETLHKFGFSRVFQWIQDSNNKNIFKIGDYIGVEEQRVIKKLKSGKMVFIANELELTEGRISVWYNKETKRKELKKFLEKRLKGTGFDLKINARMLANNPNNPKPDFYINVPIFDQNGLIMLYSLDNWFDDKKDKEMFSLDRLQIIETFASAVGQIMENIKRREYFKRFQAMLTHGTMEPLQIMRNFLNQINRQTDNKLRAKLTEQANAGLGMVQSALGSLLTLERGLNRIHIEKVSINKLLINQIQLFKSYAEAGDKIIKFDLLLPDEIILFNTDKTVLGQILNNIIGNSLRHLLRLDQEDKRIIIEVINYDFYLDIIISDNGQGLPVSLISFFKRHFRPGGIFPTGGLGIGFSREMAYMLGGCLELVEHPQVKGTKFKLTLNKWRKK